MPTNAAAKLSADQRDLLGKLLHYYRHAEANGDAQAKAILATCGVPLKWVRRLQPGYTWTAAASAAFSRTLKRLEARGLIVRSNSVNGMTSGPLAGKIRKSADEPYDARTCSLFLTPAGREVAETVNKRK